MSETQQAHDYSYGAVYDQGVGWYGVVCQYDTKNVEGSLRFITHQWSSNNPIGIDEDHPTIAARVAKRFCLQNPIVGHEYPGWTFEGSIIRPNRR